MKKAVTFSILAILLVGLVLSSGCIRKPEVEEKPKGAFAGGSQGIAMSFFSGMPPAETFERTDFSIGVQLENKGEHTVAKGAAKVYIGGIDPTIFKLNPATAVKSNTMELTQVRKIGDTITPGGQELVTFESKGYQGELPGDTDFTIVAKACYPYQSTAIATACIKENLFRQATGGPELCKVTGAKTAYNSGSPLHVTSITEIPMGEIREEKREREIGEIKAIKLGFQIKVKNAGAGYTYYPTTVDCNKAGIGQTDKVRIKSVKLGTRDFTTGCSPRDLSLVGGEATTLCTTEFKPAAGEYEDVLTIELEYGYAQQVTQRMTVRHIS